LKFLTSELTKYADRVNQQHFRLPLGKGQNPVTMTNIIANFQLNNPSRILLCAHWDTRPWADQDPLTANRMKPVMGANDGASGVAVLLEIARLIKLNPPPYGIDIVLFDGEDSGTYGDNDSWAVGSKEFAKRKPHDYNPMYGILLDLIGDKDQQIYIEANSNRYAPHIVNKIWHKADELGITTFIPDIGYEVMDDHIRLLEAGILCVDLIDFDYPYWHTTEDTPDKCSPESLENVGRVILSIIYEN
jgi:glutaminyl-peptide cyclotransferase